MTRQIDWHARFEALLTPKPPTPHEASETPADGPRALGGRAGWRHVGGCLFWLLVVPGAWVAFVVACVERAVT